MSALGDRGITLEGLAAAVDALRQELATWKALARKQDALSVDQITATQSGATAAKISQIAVNTAAIQSLAAQVAGQISLAYVTTLPATGEPLTLYLVPQGDGTAPNFCNEYLWINDAWELIGTTGAMANNGELTIQVNGVAVGTFTANQATNSAVNITVPTNTNQLVNGAGYVDTAALQAALLLKQNNLNPAQLEAVNSGITAAAVQQIADNADAIAGKQDALTAAQQAAVDSGATAAKIDQIAANASAIVSLTSSKQDSLSTTQLAAVNSGVTSAAVQQIGANASNISSLQTAVASKAADDQVVHLAGAETIPGDKTFTGAVLNDGFYEKTQETAIDVRTNPSANQSSDVIKIWSGAQSTRGDYLGGISFVQYTDGSMRLQLICFGYPTSGNAYQRRINFRTYRDGTSTLYPESSGLIDLGTSGNKWKTLNGINPGALSFPSNSGASFSGDITNTTGTVTNSKTWTVNGWGYIRVPNRATSDFVSVVTSGSYEAYLVTGTGAGNTNIGVFFPIVAGRTYNIYISTSGNVTAYYFPCLGNV